MAIAAMAFLKGKRKHTLFALLAMGILVPEISEARFFRRCFSCRPRMMRMQPRMQPQGPQFSQGPQFAPQGFRPGPQSFGGPQGGPQGFPQNFSHGGGGNNFGFGPGPRPFQQFNSGPFPVAGFPSAGQFPPEGEGQPMGTPPPSFGGSPTPQRVAATAPVPMQPATTPAAVPAAQPEATAIPAPPAETVKSSLSPYEPVNQTENPGWKVEFISTQADKVLSSCQATLVNVLAGVCYAATASHCLAASLADAALKIAEDKKNADLISRNENDISIPIRMRGLGTGLVEATAHVNHDYFKGDKDDSAILEWQCGSQPAGMKLVSVATNTPQPGAPVRYGKIMGGKAGLYSGRVSTQYRTTGPNGLPVTYDLDTKMMEVDQQPGYQTENGDSGGPLLDQNGNLVGTLNGAIVSGPLGGRARYGAQRTSLEFIRRVSRLLDRRA